MECIYNSTIKKKKLLYILLMNKLNQLFKNNIVNVNRRYYYIILPTVDNIIPINNVGKFLFKRLINNRVHININIQK